MAGSTSKKNRTKRKKNKQSSSRRHSANEARRDKGAFYFEYGLYYADLGNAEKAETFLKKAVKCDPDNRDALLMLARLGQDNEKPELVKYGLLQAYERQLLENIPQENDWSLLLCHHLVYLEDFQQGRTIAEDLWTRRETLKLKNPKKFERELGEIIAYSTARLDYVKQPAAENARRNRTSRPEKNTGKKPSGASKSDGKSEKGPKTAAAKQTEPKAAAATEKAAAKPTPPEIPVALEIGENSIAQAFEKAVPASAQHYELVMDAVQLRFQETFDHLLCFNTLQGIAFLAYQEETARKVLKRFRGRALLADEVGMGKTIEACMVLKEYIMRRMIRNALVLAPTPLVSQWQEELSSKFGLQFVSTDDRNLRGEDFWQQPFIVASINIAKSKKNFAAVSEREWDMVIADEAHHFKNKTTLNWKLLNALKKRFLLMLTATPVENNLMELYNLITLLKPGQLKTASAFKAEFMTRGDATDPRNRTRLKGLLDQVMIRNTRAVANIHIPPRFAETVRIDPVPAETELYKRVSELVRDINASASKGTRNRIILQHLLAEAGSSPAAVEKTLSELAGRQELINRHNDEIQAIRNLTRSMGDTGKNKMMLNLINSANEKIIVFVKYRATLDHLSDVLAWHGISHSVFHGQMPNARKDKEVDAFKDKKKVLLTTELGGEGRNLQFCRRMINYDLPWNPMRIEQRIGRIHRIGQSREVLIYNLCAAGTLEDYILDILDRKINMFEMVVGEIDMIMGRMRGEQDFTDMIYDIWVNETSENERREAFNKLGTRLKRYKTGYEKTKSLDEKLFGENYEA